MVPCPVAVEAFHVDQVRCSTPSPASAHVMMIEDGSLDSACGGTVTQLAETPGSDEGAAGVVGVGLAAVAGLATGAESAGAGGLALADADGVPDSAGVAGAVAWLAAAARAAEDASLAALVPWAPHAETARVSPASEQAANVIGSEREVFMPSTTAEGRRRLRSVWLAGACGVSGAFGVSGGGAE